MITRDSIGIYDMNKVASVLKPLMPILSAIYGIAIIYVTA